MKLKNKLVTVAGLGIAGSLLGASAAMAAPAPAPLHPHVYTAVTQLPQRGDSGQSSTWAVDNETRVLKIVQVPGNPQIPNVFNYKATVTDKGTFTTNTNVLAPNQTGIFAGVKTGHFKIHGTEQGGASYTFSTNAKVSNHFNLGVPGYENDHGNYISSPAVNSTSYWFEQAFPAGTMFNGVAAGVALPTGGIQNNWKWTYNANVLTGFHKVVTWNKVFTGYKWELVPTWKNGHKSLKWEHIKQYKLVPHTSLKPQYKHEVYVDAATEFGEIAGL